MPFYKVGLDEATAMQLDRYIKEKVISIVSQEINKDEWDKDSILLLKSYQNELRQGIKDLWIQFDRHTEQLTATYKIVTGDNQTAKTSLELSTCPLKLLEERITQLEKRIQRNH
jgi:hypothetical protein